MLAEFRYLLSVIRYPLSGYPLTVGDAMGFGRRLSGIPGDLYVNNNLDDG